MNEFQILAALGCLIALVFLAYVDVYMVVIAFVVLAYVDVYMVVVRRRRRLIADQGEREMSSQSSRLMNILPFAFLLTIEVWLIYVIPDDPTLIGWFIKFVLVIASILLAAGIITETVGIFRFARTAKVEET